MDEPETAAANQVERQCFEGDDGANLVEYAMLLALIFVVCLSAVVLFGDLSTAKMSCVSNAITTQVGAQC